VTVEAYERDTLGPALDRVDGFRETTHDTHTQTRHSAGVGEPVASTIGARGVCVPVMLVALVAGSSARTLQA
jgi:hypothetical protein